MKVTFKDLKQQKFVIEAEPSETIASVKQKISEERGWEPITQKLIYSGKILKDEDTVESSNIEEKGFVVCVVKKPTKPAAAAPAAEPSAAAASTSAVPATPARAAVPTATPAAPAAAAAPPAAAAAAATPTPAARAGASEAAAAGFADANSFSMGPALEEALANMEAMGFERSQINAAMRAAFNNPDRAVEYLLNGIPDNLQQQQQQQQQAPAAAAAAPAATPSGDDAATDAAVAAAAAGGGDGFDDDAGVNLFDLAAQHGRGGGGGGGGGAAALAAAAEAADAGDATPGLGNLDFLRHNAQFQQLRQVVQQQPQMLEPILQQLGAGNPQLAQLIAQNPDQFLSLLSEDGDDDDAPLPPGAQAIAVTEEERDAIERLCRLGFDRDQAIQAYFACDKNEELAANFLFDQPDDDEPHGNQ